MDKPTSEEVCEEHVVELEALGLLYGHHDRLGLEQLLGQPRARLLAADEDDLVRAKVNAPPCSALLATEELRDNVPLTRQRRWEEVLLSLRSRPFETVNTSTTMRLHTPQQKHKSNSHSSPPSAEASLR